MKSRGLIIPVATIYASVRIAPVVLSAKSKPRISIVVDITSAHVAEKMFAKSYSRSRVSLFVNYTIHIFLAATSAV